MKIIYIHTGLVSGVVYRLFVSAETDITSQIPDSEFDNRGVAFVYPQPVQEDSPNTELVTGVTVSATGVAVVAVIVIIIPVLVFCRRKVQITKKRNEQQSETAVDLDTNLSYGLVTKPPVTSPATAQPQLNPPYKPDLSNSEPADYEVLNV